MQVALDIAAETRPLRGPGAQAARRGWLWWCAVFGLVMCLVSGLGPGVGYGQEDFVDLNTATAEQLVTLPGIGPSKAQAILEYRAQIGAFKEPSELKQVTGIGTATFAKLCTRLKVGATRGCGGGPVMPKDVPEEVEVIGSDDDPRININTASLETLQALPGVGPKRAEAIIERRTSRGPFGSPEELIEIHGIGDKTLEKIVPFVRVTTDVNQITAEELVATGVVSAEQAAAIVAFRTRSGGIRKVEQLEKVRGVDASTVTRLKPYLSL